MKQNEERGIGDFTGKSEAKKTEADKNELGFD